MGCANRAILELLFSGGMRGQRTVQPELVTELTWSGESLLLEVRVIRTDQSLLVNQAANAIEQYLCSRHDNLKPLFLNNSRNVHKDLSDQDGVDASESRRLTPRSVQRIVTKYARLAGITKHVTPHTPAPLLCHRPANERSRPALGSVNARTQQHCHNSNIYPCYRPSSERSPRQVSKRIMNACSYPS